MRLVLLILLLISPSLAIAERWSVRDWYGNKTEGNCLIGTSDKKRNKFLYMGYTDGRTTINNFAFSPIFQFTVSDVIPFVFETTTFKVKLVFNDDLMFNTIIQSSYSNDGSAHFSYTQVSRNKVIQLFQNEDLSQKVLTDLMKKSRSMKLVNDQYQTIAEFSTMGFTKIHAKFSQCMQSFGP